MFLKKNKLMPALAALVFILALTVAVASISGRRSDGVKTDTAKEQSKKDTKVVPDNKKTPSKYAPSQVIVSFDGSATKEDIEKIKESTGVSGTIKTINGAGGSKIYVFELKSGVSVEDAVKSLNANKLVKTAEPNYIRNLL